MLATVEQAVTTAPVEWDVQKLESLKKSDLQALLKGNDLKGFSKTKPEIVQILLEHYKSRNAQQGSEQSTINEGPTAPTEAPESEGSTTESPTEMDSVGKDEPKVPEPVAQNNSRGRAGRTKKVAEEPATNGSNDAMDVDKPVNEDEERGSTTDKVQEAPTTKVGQSPQPGDVLTSRLQSSKTINAKRKSLYAPGETPIPKFLLQHNLSYLESVLKREDLFNWQLLRMMTVSDFKAIGVSAGTALRFILAVKEEFPETSSANDNASCVSITIAADDVKSLMDQLEGKLGSLALMDEASKSQLPSNRPAPLKTVKRQPSRIFKTTEAPNESVKERLKTQPSRSRLSPQEEVPMKSAPTPVRPSAAFAAPAKKPLERKTRETRATSASAGSIGAEVKPAERVISRTKSIAGSLNVAFGSSTPVAPGRQMIARKPTARAQAKGVNPLKANKATAPNPDDAIVRATSPESSDGHDGSDD